MTRKATAPARVIVGASVVAILTSALAVRVGRVQAQSTLTIDCPTGFAEVDAVGAAPAFMPLTSLKTVPNPIFPVDPVTGVAALRADLKTYIVNPAAAIQLGKALFWDIQASSDNKVACGSCHFHAGVDSRAAGQLHPGANGQWVDSGLSSASFGPNYKMLAGDFPFTDPDGDRTDNTVGSQGVRRSQFVNVTTAGAESTTVVADPVFTLNGANVRQATGMQAPGTYNAVFNHRNFWDGRAQPDFNGVNPFGTRDVNARIYVLDLLGNPVKMDVRIQNAALASQAVGPAMSDVEMSAIGRPFPMLGRKLLAKKPLGLQTVHPADSVLGPLADTVAGKGLKVTYTSLIQQAFAPKYWNSIKTVSIGGKSYTMMQANFSLFWGLSIMLYESTLISDDTPMDRYLASRTFDPVTGQVSGGDPSVFDPLIARLAAEGVVITREEIIEGLGLFELPMAPETAKGQGVPNGFGAGCSVCHIGAELTSASVRNLVTHGLEPGDAAFRGAGFDPRMERMFMQLPPVPEGTDQITFDPATYEVKVTRKNGTPEEPHAVRNAVYDAGWYNVAVRPAVENLGLGAKDPFGNFLSWTQMFQALPYPQMVKVPGGGLGCGVTPPAAPATSPFAGEVLNPITNMPLLAGPLTKTGDTAVQGSFKTPSIRNIELTGPYLHNGGKATLLQVVELYDDGGDFPAANRDKSPAIMRLNLTSGQIKSLVAFMLSLTDERVRWKKAPFDHPELKVPHGVRPDTGADIFINLPAIGASGAATPLGRFLNLKPMD